MEPTKLTGLTLDTLVAALERSHDDVLDRLADAMIIAEHLDRTGDELIEHVVSTARGRGLSWSEIGARMGISKQAAQQRLAKATQVELEPLSPEQGFSRFTIEARNVLLAAHEAARVRREPFVTSARLAVATGIDSSSVQLPEPVPPAEARDVVPYDEEAQQALARAFELAIAAGADMVDLSHVVEAVSAQR